MALLNQSIDYSPYALMALGSGLLQGSMPGQNLASGLSAGLQGMTPYLVEGARARQEQAKQQALYEGLQPILGQPARTIESPVFQSGANMQPATGLAASQPELAGLLGAYAQTDPQAVAGLLSKQMMTPPVAGKDRFMEVDGQIFDTSTQSLIGLPGVSPKKQKEVFDQEQKLRGEFTKETADFAKQNDAFGRIRAASADPTGAGDMALIFNYMKLLDPGSTVREGEFALVGKSGGLPSQIQGLFDKVLSGKLPDPIRADVVDRAGRLYTEAASGYIKRKETYEDLAEKYGLTPENVAYPRQLYTDVPPPGFTQQVP